MGFLQTPQPVLPFCAIFGQQTDALAWTREIAAKAWGSIALAGPEMEFVDTAYYEKEMGQGLKKQLLVFEDLKDPQWLPEAKQSSNRWEQQYLESADFTTARPVNIDPGYVTLAKLVLATTKDRDHRLYLGGGIFAEVTLHYKFGQWRSDRWTYPDFQRAEYHQFLDQSRQLLKSKLKSL